MNKRITAYLMVFVFMVTTFSYLVQATGTPTITVSSTEANAGDTITLDVSVNNNPGINTFSLGFNYDTDRLNLVNVTPSSSLGGQFSYAKKAVWLNSSDTTYNGKILTLTFKVLDNAASGNASVGVTYNRGDISNYDEDDVEFNLVDGQVTIKDLGSQTTKGTISVSSTEANAGDTITLDVSVNNNPGINTFSLGFNYDTDRLNLVNVTPSSSLGGQFSYAKKAVWLNSSDTTYNGKILTLTFKVLDNAVSGNASVGVTYNKGDISNYDEDDVEFNLVDGQITVKDLGSQTTQGTISVSSTQANAGDTVTLDVSISDNPGINTFSLGFAYDTEKLRLLNVTPSSSLGGQFSYVKKAVWLNSTDTTYSGKILTLTFKVLDNATVGNVSVAVTYNTGDISNYNEDDVELNLTAGLITIEDSGFQTYTIAYNANGGSGSMGTSSIIVGQKLTLADCEYTKTGYSFTGYKVCRKSDNKWYVSDKGWFTETEINNNKYSKKVFAAKSTWDFDSTWCNSAVSTDTYIFYAVWKVNTKIALDKTALELGIGASETLTAILTPKNDSMTVNWKSSNTKIATVNKNGIVTSVSKGTATITASLSNGEKATCTVTVKKYPDSISLNKTSVVLGVGQTCTLNTTITPVDAETTYSWSSTDKTVATVNSNGKITARKVGTAVIKVKTINGQIASCKVTVRPAPESVALNKTSAVMGVKQTCTLTAALTPSNSATYCTWTSSDKAIATVTSAGKVTAKKVGKVTITVKTSNGKTATCTITVKKAPESITLNKTSATIGVKQTCNLTATLSPDNSATYCSWSSSDKTIATVNADGIVTAKEAGAVTIMVKTSNGKVAVCTITVKKAPESITLNKTSATIGVKQTCNLTAVLSPDNSATDCSWSSSDETIATVTSTGKVTAKKVGKVNITVKTYNGKTATCIITVKKAPESVALDKTSITLGVGQTYTLKKTVTPSDALTDYTYSSTYTSVATVTSSGKIIAKKAGVTTVTVTTHNNKTVTCTITVKSAPESVTLNKTSATIGVKQTCNLTAVLSPDNSATDCSWSSSDEAIATVTSTGKVIAKKVGKVNITVKTYNGKTATCIITVKKAPESVALDKTSITLGVGQTYTLKKTVVPSDALTDYTYSSTYTSVATVTSSGKIIAKKAGVTTVTVTTHNNKTAVCTVTVKSAPESVTLNKTSATIGVKQTCKLTAILSPDNSVTDCSWSSSDETIATVDSTGKVTAKKVGKVNITVKTYNGKTAICIITVKKAPDSITLNKTATTIKVGQTETLKAALTPSNSVTYCNWSSSDKTIATVNADGVVTAKKAGAVTIMVKTSNGKVAVCTVTVKK